MSAPVFYSQGIFRTCNYRMLTQSAKYIRDKAAGFNLRLQDVS